MQQLQQEYQQQSEHQEFPFTVEWNLICSILKYIAVDGLQDSYALLKSSDA